MKRLILAALAVAAFGMAAPAAAQTTQDLQAQRTQRRAEMQQRMAQRRAEMQQRRVERLQQLAERRPELKQRIDRRLAEGKKLQPLARKLMVQRRLNRMKVLRPELFDRLDLNKDGVLSRDEFAPRQRPRRKV